MINLANFIIFLSTFNTINIVLVNGKVIDNGFGTDLALINLVIMDSIPKNVFFVDIKLLFQGFKFFCKLLVNIVDNVVHEIFIFGLN